MRLGPWLVASALAVTPAVAAAQLYSGHEQQKIYPQGQPHPLPLQANPRITVPPSSRLLGTAQLDEIRSFPEEQHQNEIQRVVGVQAVDQAYETDRSYDKAVSYFDQEFGAGGFQVQERTVRPHSTLWTVRRPDGTVARVAVRNTTPTTFEVIEVASEKTNHKGILSAPPSPPVMNEPRPALPQTDREFVTRAQEANLSEIDNAKLALQRASSGNALDLAKQMLEDHRQAAQELSRLAQEEGFPVPTQPNRLQRAEFDQLTELTGAEFDHAFLQNEIRDHQQAIRDFQTEAENGQNAALRGYAQHTLPLLQKHEQLALLGARSL